PPPGWGNFVMGLADLDARAGVQYDVVGLLPDVLEEPGAGGDLAQPPPLGAQARPRHVPAEAQPLHDGHRTEAQEINGRAEPVQPTVVEERRAHVPPVKVGADAQLVHHLEEGVVSAADEMIEVLDALALEAEGGGEASRHGSRFQQGYLLAREGEIAGRG